MGPIAMLFSKSRANSTSNLWTLGTDKSKSTLYREVNKLSIEFLGPVEKQKERSVIKIKDSKMCGSTKGSRTSTKSC